MIGILEVVVIVEMEEVVTVIVVVSNLKQFNNITVYSLLNDQRLTEPQQRFKEFDKHGFYIRASKLHLICMCLSL